MKTLAAMPTPDELKPILKRLALLNAILSSERCQRHHSYDIDRKDGLEVACVRSGDAVMEIFFCSEGAVVHGSDPRAGTKPAADIRQSLPRQLLFMLDDSAPFDTATFWSWRQMGASQWVSSPDDESETTGSGKNGSNFLLGMIFTDPLEFADWASHTFKIRVPPTKVEQVLQGRPMTPDMVKSLNPASRFEELFAECRRLYPFWVEP